MASRLKIFVAELRRRKVTRVAIAYSVVGFVVWQAAEIAFPALDLPDSALTFVVVVTVLGLPMALVLSWAYELRPEEPRRADSREPAERRPERQAPLLSSLDAAPASVPSAHPPVGTGSDPALPPATSSPLRDGHRVLVVDDDEGARLAHSRLVESLGYDVETAADGIEALAKMSLDVDLVMLDADMPEMDGFEVARRIRADASHAHVPIVMVTGLTGSEERTKAFEVGINDFVPKPVDAEVFRLRSRWMLELKTTYDRLTHGQAELGREVERKTAALRVALEQMTDARRVIHEVHLDTIRRMTIAAEYADRDAAGHIHRIGLYCEVLCETLGLPPTEVDTIRHAAPMHDVGKIAVPPDVLMKPAELDPTEWSLVKSHTTIGGQILSGSLSPVIQMGETIALSHHERWDGAGYPEGLSGEAIPLEGRICAVADVFDALTMDRPQRKALANKDVVEMMEGESGRHFDPNILDAFLRSLTAIEEIRQEYR